jgi:hypothetical protein
MKRLLILVSLLVGVARAEEGLPKEKSDTYKLDPETLTINICPSGWKESNWDLVDTSTKTVHFHLSTDDGVFRPTQIIPGHIGNVEVCPDNGLVRVKQ